MAANQSHASSCKRRKLSPSDNLFDIFFHNFDRFNAFIRAFKALLKNINHALLPSIIKTCDAHVSSSLGTGFRDCHCEADVDVNWPFHFGAFWGNGVKIFNCLKRRQVPDDEGLQLREVTEKLLRYVLNQERHDELKKIKEKTYLTGKTQVMVTLAEHFFSRLSVPQGYVIDQHGSKAEICKCGKCVVEKLTFDDTSIGNQCVWHGSLDMVFESSEVAVCIPANDKVDSTSGGCSNSDIKEDNLDHIKARSQAIAQTIVFSLLQKQRYRYLRHYIIPHIVANENYVKFFFYDTKNDILLESKKYQIVWDVLPVQLVFETVIATWLVLNHQILCTGTFKEYRENAPKSRFRELAKDTLPIYDSELKYRNVGLGEQLKRPFSQWDYLEVKHGDTFEWPSSLPFSCDT